jgi:fumarylacetoacetase
MKRAVKANDPALTSWVEVSPGSDFPIQNLPFGIFRTDKSQPRACTAIGEYIVDLACLLENGYFRHLALAPDIFRKPTLNDFLSLGRKNIRGVRERLSELLRSDNRLLQSNKSVRRRAFFAQRQVQMLMPIRVSNYTDFYSSEEHAMNVGAMFRDAKNPLLPNWKHLPVAYHGRASSIVVSGTPVRRPKGQIKPPDRTLPEFAATRKLDFELELAFITCGATSPGKSISTRNAEDYIAGFVLFNDWSARDIQQWEYVPLGPFLGKNFASSISPWMVTLDALEPFRTEGPRQEPRVLPYLDCSGKKNFDIVLEVSLKPPAGEESVLCRSNAKYLYWNISQQLAHHTVNGCNIDVGDLYASGTISGPSPGSFGSLLELSWNGERPLTIAGVKRVFLEDGDTVIMRAHSEKDGMRIGFGECRGKILPPLR